MRQDTTARGACGKVCRLGSEVCDTKKGLGLGIFSLLGSTFQSLQGGKREDISRKCYNQIVI